MTSVTTHFKKLTTGNNVFIVSVNFVSEVAQLSHLQFLHQMFNVSTLLLEDALKPATPLNVASWCFYRTQGSVATHLRCGGMFSDSVIANFLLILTVKEFYDTILFI